MRRLILNKIKENWNYTLFEDVSRSISVSGANLFNRIMSVIFVLRYLNSSDNSNLKIGIYMKNSINWIVVYLASILAGYSVVILRHKLNTQNLLSDILSSEVNYIFTDKTILKNEKFKSLLFLKAIISLNESNQNYFKSNIIYANELIKERIVDFDTIVKRINEVDFEIKDIHSYVDGSIKFKQSIYTPTFRMNNFINTFVIHNISSSLHKNSHELSNHNMVNFVDSVANVLPYNKLNKYDKVYARVPFESFHLLLIVVSLFKSAHVCIAPEYRLKFNYIFRNKWEAYDYLIETSEMFENTWNYIEGLNAHLSKYRILYPLFYLKALKSLKNFVGKNCKGLIILNSTINERALRILRKSNIPLYTTYGSKETGQLVAINDHSTKELKETNCVGKVLHNTEVIVNIDNFYDTNKREIMISSPIINSLKYDITDRNRKFDKPNKSPFPFYKSGDVGDIVRDKENDYLYIHGRKTSFLKDKDMVLNYYEKVIRSLPFVKHALIVLTAENAVLLIVPNEFFVESKKGMDFNMIKSISRKILPKLAKTVPLLDITKVLVVSESQLEMVEGKIKESVYRNALIRGIIQG